MARIRRRSRFRTTAFPTFRLIAYAARMAPEASSVTYRTAIGPDLPR